MKCIKFIHYQNTVNCAHVEVAQKTLQYKVKHGIDTKKNSQQRALKTQMKQTVTTFIPV